MTSMLITEIALRGAAAGVNLLVAALILFSGAPRTQRLLAVLFLWGTFVYILLSADRSIEILGPLAGYLKIFAIFNAVFFWWFALSLFDDDFRWTWWKGAPFMAVALLHLMMPFWRSQNAENVEQVLHSSISIALLAHAVWLALHDRSDDLVDPRRRFRLFFAVAIGVMGIATALGENIEVFAQLPESITLVHAVALAALTLFFASWLLSPNGDLFAVDTSPAAEVRTGSTSGLHQNALHPDALEFQNLSALMDQGVYREEGLTVAKLAEKVGVPEHHLRRLINQELGFRNFSAFLNERRIEDAKNDLVDPAKARQQIIQIALDLGYGSIAPFNRAFKAATGVTPTEFRRNAQAETLAETCAETEKL